MRIREILFHNFRSFRGERRVSFVDPLTDAVRPVSVLAGSNGSGKTTVLDAIEALLALVLEPDEPSSMILEALNTGLIHLILELSPDEVDILPEFAYLRLDDTTRLLHIAVGRKDLVPPPWEGDSFCLFYQPGATKRPWDRKETPLVDNLRLSASGSELRDKLLYLPRGCHIGKPALLPQDRLSSGERRSLFLLGDLAQRPGMVIAIDEVENSLHPTLQRLVMWNLRRIAREWDAQVIVATHSLEVINTVRGGAFINLDYPEDRFDLPLEV